MTVTNCISYWLSTWVRDYGVDGFRCDTAKHVELASWARLNEMCTEALKTWKANNPTKKLDDLDFWMTGECWDHTLSYDGYYTQGKFDSMINFDTTGAGVLSKDQVAGKYEGYAAELNTKDDYNVLSYISSHDSTLARGDMIYIGSAFLMLPGGIQIYYGDETNRPLVEGVDFDGYGGAGHSLRSDMNWESMDEEVLAHWQKVGTFRNNHISVGAGSHTTVTSTSGVAFTRTYAKNGIKDRIAACIGTSANSDVTIDVSGVWSNGESVVNYYDGSSATVSGGNVTFNSGANGTILIGDPDGKPLVTVTGASKFKGTQQVTISIKDAPQAIVSIDGAKKFIAKDGDKFTIGATAYEGDTVSVAYSATNEKGTLNGKATFYKAYQDEDIIGGGGGEDDNNEKGKVRVKMSDGSAPYIYAWKDTNTVYTEKWPGTKMTQKDSEGYYYFDIDTTGKYNVIFNGGSGAGQTDDILGLSGVTTFEVQSGFGSYKMTGGNAPVVDPVNNTITIRVKPYGSQVPCLYVWDSDNKTYNGGFPGKALTEKDENGNYILVIDGVASVSCIVNGGGNQNQTGNITGITGEALITIESADYKEYKVEKIPKVESKFSKMKQEARSVKNMTSSDYTSASWKKLYSYIASADALVAQGEANADIQQVETMYNNLVAAKSALVLATPTVTSAVTGSKTIKGKAAYGANVTVTLNGKKYTAIADEITGIWTVTASVAVKASDIVYVTAARNGLTSGQLKYEVSGSQVETVGWKKEGENWYYYNTDGSKAIGWKTISGKSYYFNTAGVMQASKWISGKYYVKADGSMAVSEIVDNGKYYVNSKGEWVKTTGWKSINGKWYYLSAGEIQKSKWISGKYYVKADGTMATSEVVDNGKYFVNADGEWVKTTGWQKAGTKWYYLVSGEVQKSKWISGKYYVKADGTMATSEIVDNGRYYVNADGVWVKTTGWKKINGKWYYLSDGTIQKSKWISGKYYVKADGTMATSEWVDNGRYYVGADGVWIKNP